MDPEPGTDQSRAGLAPSSRAGLLRCRRGATALEFALVGPLMLLLILAIIENGLMLFAQAVLDYATIAAGRQVQIGTIRTSTDFQTAVCANISSLLDCGRLQVYVANGSSGFPAVVMPSGSGTFAAPGGSTGVGGAYVLVEAAYDRTYVSPWLVRLDGNGWVLLSTQAFQNEPFS